MNWQLIRAQYKAQDGKYKARLWFRGGEWHGSVHYITGLKRKFLGATMAGQTSSEFRELTEQYLQRIIEKDKALKNT